MSTRSSVNALKSAAAFNGAGLRAVNTWFKKAIKRSLQQHGIRISRMQHADPPPPLLALGIDLVFDVGANVGQFARNAREEGYRNTIVSFEPLSVAHGLLIQSAGGDERWIVHERCALGAAPGEANMNVAQNSFSSSLLPMLATHADAAPESVYIGQDLTRIITLDSVFDRYCGGGERVFLKIDTQGYEKQVLDGARASLARIVAVQLELSVVPLYESQLPYRHFLDFFQEAGFTLWSLLPGFTDRRTSQLLQFDALFVRTSSECRASG
jgi:FkbM family methyltransferase